MPQFGRRIPAQTLRRFWTMLAHHQSGVLNGACLSRSLGVDGKTVAGYLDLMVDLLLVRRLQPWHANARKRLVKAPKVMVRDSGLVHALLGITDKDALLGHPIAGASWEAFAIENLLAAAAAAGREVLPSFYRASGGAKIDLVLSWPEGQYWAIEIKRSAAPRLVRGFHSACADIQPSRRFVVYPGSERFRIAEGVQALSLPALADEVAA